MKQRPRVHWLQHADHEELGCIAPWLDARGYRVTCTRLHLGESLPPVTELDWLIVMGGPMNIYEHDAYPWLIPEKALISDACVTDRKVLGICLGAQLLADALGAKVTPNEEAEIGWFKVDLTADGERSPAFSVLPKRFEAFHWHGDTFTIPKGATNLIKSDACVNQAFAFGRRRVAVQFHLEVREADARRWVQVDAPPPARYVQSAAEILRDPARFAKNNELMVRVLERMAGD